MKTTKTSKGFTLVEMLVVIAIISILAAALFPAIQNAMSQAAATALKSKARGIWTAVTSTNMEREPLNLGTVWPYDLTQDASTKTTVKDSCSYFTYLMSDGSDMAKIAESSEDRVSGDLSPEALIASGTSAAKAGGSVGVDNLAWGVMVITDSTSSEIPFLISRNLQNGSTPGFKQPETADAGKTAYTLDANVKPFNNIRAVWVTRGGGTFDARRKYFTQAQLMGIGSAKAPSTGDSETTQFTYWKTTPGSSSNP